MRKKTINKKFSLVLASTMVLLTMMNCKTRMMDFTVISTKNVDLSKMASYKRGNQRVEGKDTAKIILALIPIKLEANLKEAIDQAVQSVPGAVSLVDGVIYHYNLPTWPFYFENGYIIEGTPLIDPKLAASHEESSKSNYMVSLPENSGKNQLYYLTQADYETVKELAKNNLIADAARLVKLKAL